MLVYVLFICMIDSGCMSYEFKDKLQCENTKINFRKHMRYFYSFCQEVRK